MVTAVSGFIEQEHCMIKEISKRNQPFPINSIKLQRARADTCQQAILHQFIDNYPVQNCIIWLQLDAYELVFIA